MVSRSVSPGPRGAASEEPARFQLVSRQETQAVESLSLCLLVLSHVLASRTHPLSPPLSFQFVTLRHPSPSGWARASSATPLPPPRPTPPLAASLPPCLAIPSPSRSKMDLLSTVPLPLHPLPSAYVRHNAARQESNRQESDKGNVRPRPPESRTGTAKRCANRTATPMEKAACCLSSRPRLT